MAGHLVRGSKVSGRYRLEAELGQGDASTAWRAFDERLERQVSLRTYDPETDGDLLRERASVAASLTHPRVVRIFDTGYDGGQFFTVSELLPGSLSWARLPFAPQEAVDTAALVAEALRYAHQRGATHGALHPGNVLLGEQGAKVADFGLSARAIAGGRASVQDDLASLGRLLHRMLTGNDPGEEPPGSGQLTDQPHGVARIVHGLLEGGYEDAGNALDDLRRLRPASPPAKRRRPMGWVAVAALLLALIAFGVTRLGGRDPRERRGETPARIEGTPLEIASVSDFDPFGDRTEGRATISKLADGDPQTFWSTESYRSSADFSGLKPGVGAIIDLGAVREVGQAQLLFVAPGCAFEIRTSANRAAALDGWTVVTSVNEAGATNPLSFDPVESRWWLIWLTRLTEGVPGASGFACGIAEAELYAP